MAIDPRIRARRVAVRRAEGRRRLRFLGTALGLVLVVVALWGLTRTALLDLDHVAVDGVNGAEARRVEELAALERGTPMFDLDLGAATSAIEAEPWVESVTADRDWPGTVRFAVVPRAAVAVLAGDAGAFLVDDQGVVIALAPDDSTLPVVRWDVGVELGGEQRDALPGIAVARALPEDLRPWVEAVTVEVGDGATDLGLDLIGSAVAVLGDAGLVEDKLQAVRAVLARTDLACVDEIDVIVPDLDTIRRDEACEADRSGTDAGEAADG
ncbi:MAG: FtsQ-type POTRA domain-containing protein [Actinomycetota bacterium]